MMTALTLPQSLQNILVVGTIYNKLNKLDKIESLLPQYDWIVFNDSISFTDNNISSVVSQIKRMDQLLASGKVVYNVGNMDLTLANKMDIWDPDQLTIAEWIQNKPNVVMIDFDGSFQVVILSGGIPSHITHREQLEDNIEVSFATHPHEIYSGGLGYVICNGPLTPWAPKFYRYSVQIDNTLAGQV